MQKQELLTKFYLYLIVWVLYYMNFKIYFFQEPLLLTTTMMTLIFSVLMRKKRKVRKLPKFVKKGWTPMLPKNPRNPPLSPRPQSCLIANLGTMKPTWTTCSKKLRRLKWTDLSGVLTNLFPLDTASANSR